MANDGIQWIGIGLNFLLAAGTLWHSVRTSKRTAYHKLVTEERIKGMANVCQKVAHILSLAETWATNRPSDQTAALNLHADMGRAMTEIELSLASDSKEGAVLLKALAELPNWNQAVASRSELDAIRARIISATQRWQKVESAKINEEALKGRASDPRRNGSARS